MNWKLILLKKDWIHHKARNLLSALSILLGVAVIIATAIAASSTKNTFLQMVDSQSSGAGLIAVSAADQQIRTAAFSYSNSAIEDALPFFSEDCYFENGGTYHSLTRMAVDFGGESKYGGYWLSGGNLPKDGECLVPETMKTEFHLNQGDTITLRTDAGSTDLTISGFVENAGIATTNLGKCILTDYQNTPGSGSVTFKLMLKPGTDMKSAKEEIQNALQGTYTVDSPAGQTEQILKEADLLFNTMKGFGFLTLLLGGFLINVTVNEYVRKMRQKIAVLKVLGAVKSDILGLVLSKSLIIGLIGTLCGAAAGVIGSWGLIRLTDRSFNGGMDIQPVIQGNFIAAVVIGSLLFCMLISLPAALRAARENIIDGFHQFDKIAAVSIRKIVITGVLSVGFVAARIFSGQWLFTFAAIAAGIYFFALIAFIPCARLMLRLVNHVSAFNGFTVKNNLMKQSGKAIHLSVLFSFVIAISVGIILVVNEIALSTDRMEKGEYFGDAVVSTVTGQGLGSDVLSKVQAADGVDKAYPIYQKYIDIGSDNVQVKGFCLDGTNESFLTDYWMIDSASLQKLSDSPAILLSQKVMEDQKLNIGDFITIGSGTDNVVKIVGTYSTMNNDGKSGILSDHNFLKLFQNYSIRTINVFQNSGIAFETLKSNITSSVGDSFIQVDSTSYMQKTEAKQSDQFLMLIDCMIIILVAASILMLVNSISLNIKNNEYTLSVTKLLGATNRNLVLQSSIEGMLYGLFGVAVGIPSGIVLNFIMTSSMNKMTAWNLQTTMPVSILILCGIGFLLVVLLAEIIATALNYKKDYKAVLVQE